MAIPASHCFLLRSGGRKATHRKGIPPVRRYGFALLWVPDLLQSHMAHTELVFLLHCTL